MAPKDIMNDVLALVDLHRPTWGGISAAIERSGVPTMHVVEGGLKDKLKQIEEGLAEAREERVGLAKTRDDAREAYAGTKDLTGESAEFKEAEEAVRALGECDDKIGALTAAPTPAGQATPAGDPSDPRGGWDSSRLFADEDMRARLRYAASSKGQIGPIELGEVASREQLAADVAPSTDARRGQWLGVIPQLRLMLRVLDIIPTGTMDNNTLPYTREEGSFETAAGAKEGATKAEGAITFTDAEAVARTIAHWLKIRKQGLEDFSALRGIIDSRLRYGVQRILEKEIIGGKGADPELEGIYPTTGVQVVKWVTGDITGGADPLLKGITAILLADAQATGIVAHPTDWEELLKAKATGGDLHYFSAGPFSMTPQTIWGVPLIASRAVPQSAPLVGDFEIGAQLFIRSGVNVLLSDSDQDDFIKNRVTMLAEMRAALAVFRPTAFAKVYLTKAVEEAKV
jgi:hypothetical protein